MDTVKPLELQMNGIIKMFQKVFSEVRKRLVKSKSHELKSEKLPISQKWALIISTVLLESRLTDLMKSEVCTQKMNENYQ